MLADAVPDQETALESMQECSPGPNEIIRKADPRGGFQHRVPGQDIEGLNDISGKAQVGSVLLACQLDLRI